MSQQQIDTLISQLLIACVPALLGLTAAWIINRKKGLADVRVVELAADKAQHDMVQAWKLEVAKNDAELREMRRECHERIDGLERRQKELEAANRAKSEQLDSLRAEGIAKDRRIDDLEARQALLEAHITELYNVVEEHPDGPDILKQLKTKRPNGTMEGRQSK
jgi:chromosome segregation ATPase